MRLHVSRPVWMATWYGLQRRSANEIEAACVWLGTRSEDIETALDVVFLDDLPGTVGRRLQHRTSRQAVAMLLDLARARGLRIVADIHTHPSEWVDLSDVDREHPIEYRPGLIALVLPTFALDPPDLTRTGVHEYIGRGEWVRIKSDVLPSRLVIEER